MNVTAVQARSVKRRLFEDEASPQRKKNATYDKVKGVAESTEWMNKSPCLTGGMITINGTAHQIEQIGQGTFHKVFNFTSSRQLSLNDAVYDTHDVVLKVLMLNLTPDKAKEVMIKDIRGYEHLISKNVPVAKVYVNPKNFQDQIDDKNGRFWIVEKMEKPISGESWKGESAFECLSEEDRRILTWAKGWLTQMATAQEDIINDFRIRNTMLNSIGEPCVVDFCEPESDPEDFEMNLFSYVKNWSSGNPNIFEHLISEFPKEVKDSMNTFYLTYTTRL